MDDHHLGLWRKWSPPRPRTQSLLCQLPSQVRAKTRDLLGSLVGRVHTFRPEDALVIFAEPRGGSTWLTEVISTTPKTAVLWEPVAHGRPFKYLFFAPRQFIPRTADWPAAEDAFDDVFRGRILNHCTCKLSSPLSFVHADHLLVKFCRANALLPWIGRVFRFNFTPVLLLRHPFAVAASQLRHPAWAHQPSQYHIPTCRYRHHYADHATFLSTLKTKAEVLVATWCLSNLVPLRTPDHERSWLTVYYEELLLDPAEQIRRLFDAWHLPIPDGAMRQASIASITARDPAITERAVDQQLAKWHKTFTESQIEALLRVLQYFEIEVYSAALMPHR